MSLGLELRLGISWDGVRVKGRVLGYLLQSP